MEKARKLSEHVWLLGNGNFNYYLVGNGERAVLFECGCSVGIVFFEQQYRQLDHPPRVEHIVLMHSHFDHSCGLPRLKAMFPQAQVWGSAAGKKILSKEKLVELFFTIDQGVVQRYFDEGFVDEWPDNGYAGGRLEVDRVMEDGEHLVLADGPTITLLATPGHSACSISAWIEPDLVLLHSDATGIQVNENKIAPAYFNDYTKYLDSIKKLATFPAVIAGGGHGAIIEGENAVADYYRLAIQSTRQCHDDIAARLAAGDDEADIVERLYTDGVGSGVEYYPEAVMRSSMAGMIPRNSNRD